MFNTYYQHLLSFFSMTFSMVSVSIYVINLYFFWLTQKYHKWHNYFKKRDKKTEYISNNFILLKLKTKRVFTLSD